MHVYISGPYTKPDPVTNTRKTIIVADRIRDLGHAPFLPHLYITWDMVSPASYDEWLKLCLAWVPKCDVLIRLPGESVGADVEVELARELGIPIFYGIDSFMAQHNNPAMVAFAMAPGTQLGRMGFAVDSSSFENAANILNEDNPPKFDDIELPRTWGFFVSFPCPHCGGSIAMEGEGTV